MARSSYIYLVYDWFVEEPVAAFTVKHELLTWLSGINDHGNFVVWRLRDGATYDSHPPTTMQELLV